MESPSFAFLMPCCRATTARRFSSSNDANRYTTKSRSRFINRTGSAAVMAARTRMPVVLGNRSFLALLLLLGLALGIIRDLLRTLPGMMPWAVSLRANLADFALVDTVLHDGFSNVFAGFERRRTASSLVVGFSGRISVYLLRGKLGLPSCFWP
jgi:hypothetical protein